MSDTRIPKSIAENEITLFGVTLHCHVLDDGQRIIDADDVAELFEAMQRSVEPEVGDTAGATGEAMDALARFCRGLH